MRYICSWWYWPLLAKSTTSNFCIQPEQHELQQSKLEVYKAHLTIPRLSQKQIKQSLFHMSKCFFHLGKLHGRMREVSSWHWGYILLWRFPTTVEASVAISSSDELPFVTSASVSYDFRSSQEPIMICWLHSRFMVKAEPVQIQRNISLMKVAWESMASPDSTEMS